MRMSHLYLFLVPLALIWGISLPARAAEPTERRDTISVMGQAEVRAEPDRAHVTFGVESQGKNAQEAQSGANEVIQRILDRLEQMGIARRLIQTSTVNLFPIHERPRPQAVEQPQEPRIIGYRAVYTLTVQLNELGKVGPVIDAAMAAGANRVDGIRFSLAEDLPARLQALEAASEEARRKAQAIARAMDVSLGPLVSVSESHAQIFPVMGRGGGFDMAARAEFATPVAPGEVNVQASVTVVYSFRNRR